MAQLIVAGGCPLLPYRTREMPQAFPTRHALCQVRSTKIKFGKLIGAIQR